MGTGTLAATVARKFSRVASISSTSAVRSCAAADLPAFSFIANLTRSNSNLTCSSVSFITMEGSTEDLDRFKAIQAQGAIVWDLEEISRN
jgi:hypothetical protein